MIPPSPLLSTAQANGVTRAPILPARARRPADPAAAAPASTRRPAADRPAGRERTTAHPAHAGQRSRRQDLCVDCGFPGSGRRDPGRQRRMAASLRLTDENVRAGVDRPAGLRGRRAVRRTTASRARPPCAAPYAGGAPRAPRAPLGSAARTEPTGTKVPGPRSPRSHSPNTPDPATLGQLPGPDASRRRSPPGSTARGRHGRPPQGETDGHDRERNEHDSPHPRAPAPAASPGDPARPRARQRIARSRRAVARPLHRLAGGDGQRVRDRHDRHLDDPGDGALQRLEP